MEKKTAHASEQELPSLLKRRQAWFDDQLDLDPAKLVFIDETSLSTKMARRYGRAPRGERCRSGVPHGHWKTTTFTGALRLTGMTAPKREARQQCERVEAMRTPIQPPAGRPIAVARPSKPKRGTEPAFVDPGQMSLF